MTSSFSRVGPQVCGTVAESQADICPKLSCRSEVGFKPKLARRAPKSGRSRESLKRSRPQLAERGQEPAPELRRLPGWRVLLFPPRECPIFLQTRPLCDPGTYSREGHAELGKRL